ncbi:MAG: hypothetical protein GX275_12380 [Clostridiales bacterium]|nr:hypothetical protein [Clostridiales bacterium]
MDILFTITCIVGIVFMCIFSFIGIWLFVIALKSYRQLRYKNYILEKIYQKIGTNSNNQSNDKPSSLQDSLDFFDLGCEKENNNFDNIKNFEKLNNKDVL